MQFRIVFLLVLALVGSPIATAMEISLDGVKDSALADNIEAHLSTLSTPANCILTDDAEVTITEKIEEAGKALGYYHLEVLQIAFKSKPDCEVIAISVAPKQPVKVTQVTVNISGDGQKDPQFQSLLDRAKQLEGKFLNHQQYGSIKSRFNSLAQNRGYFESRFEAARIAIDIEANTAVIELLFESGKRFEFGEIQFPDDLRAKELILQVANFSAGQPYLVSTLGEFNQKLNQTGYFQQVIARPIVNKAENYQVPIEVIATSRPRDIFNVGGGVSTDIGPQFKLNWQRPWVNSDGHSMSADLLVSAPKQALSFRYKIPVDDPLYNYYSLQAGIKQEDDSDSDKDSQTLSVAVQRHWSKSPEDWNKIAFLRYEQERFQQGDEVEQTTRLLIPGFTLSRRRSRGGLDVDWGDRQMVTIETASKSVLSDIDLTRVTMLTKWIRSLGDHRFLLRAEAGALSSSDFTQVPSSLRYFTGGDQNVRGFGYETLAPSELDENGERILLGGRYLNVASAEYSYPVFEQWRAALFVDAGNASNEPLEDLAYSFGVGASWLSPVGPIRLYLARGKSDFENTFRIHFSMGPAL